MRSPRRAFWAPIVCVLLSCGGTSPLDPGVGDSADASGGGASAAGAGGTNAGSAGAGGRSAAGAPGAGGHAGGLPACAQSVGANIVRPLADACTSGDFSTTHTACDSDSDCVVGNFPGKKVRCLDHVCTAAACFVNEDCPGHDVCICASAVRLYNTCQPADCRTDADCGAGGICQATFIPSCTSGPMYTCLSAADTCCSYADCPSGGLGCEFFPTLGHFRCVTTPMCIGGV